MAIDLSPELEHISRRLAAEKGMDEAARNALLSSYLKFLSTAAATKDAVVPSLAVDELWHRHILDTQSYGRDCERWFGTFIHHQPEVTAGEARPRDSADCSAPAPPTPTCNSVRADAAADCSSPDPGPPCRAVAAMPVQ
ncbi:MAG TPA: hypothetical protein VF650_16335 [Allosphingosinicella sp.]